MITEEVIERFQSNLIIIRKAVGWSGEELGDRIGVTRQTINNLENHKCKLSKTQYLAMRSVLETEMGEYPEETEILKVVLEVLVDNPDKYSEKDRMEVFEKTNMLSPAILNGSSSRKEVAKIWKALITGLGIMTGASIAALIIGAWRKK